MLASGRFIISAHKFGSELAERKSQNICQKITHAVLCKVFNKNGYILYPGNGWDVVRQLTQTAQTVPHTVWCLTFPVIACAISKLGVIDFMRFVKDSGTAPMSMPHIPIQFIFEIGYKCGSISAEIILTSFNQAGVKKQSGIAVGCNVDKGKMRMTRWKAQMGGNMH